MWRDSSDISVCVRVRVYVYISHLYPIQSWTGPISGVISERDYVSKIALLGRKSKETAIKEISTKTANLVTATPKESVDECMQKMLQRDIRHLPLLDDGGKVIGMLSVKDLVKTLVQEKEDTIKVLSDFALGKGGHFGSE
jgi:CBS domain-containing protein